MTGGQEAVQPEGVSSETPAPKGLPTLMGPPAEPKEDETGDQRPQAAKKAKPTSRPDDLRAPATNDWIDMPARERMGIADDEDIEMLHISAPPLPKQVRITFPCTKTA